MMGGDRFVLQVYVGAFSRLYEALSIEASKQTSAEEIVECIAEKLSLKEAVLYELAEVVGNEGGQDCKERRIGPAECPVALQLLWPKNPKLSLMENSTGAYASFSGPEYRFCLRRKLMQSMNWSFSWTDSNDSQLLKDYFLRFLYQPRDREYPDLCQLPDLTEQTLLENLKARFDKGHIYTYVGSILIAVNPFKFYPIYNPKYVQLYQNRRLGDLPPHIFAIADAAYQAMLRKRCNQCIVISGESGSGKTESTNLLLHHLTALAQKGCHGSGVERTILGAGPVLEAFGNAKTKHNNNSSRFGKFIQVNYKENGMVHGAIVQKYLLEKSRIVSQAKNERNYHVFYYLLAGCSQAEKETLHLSKPSDYHYLNQSRCYTLEGVDEAYELSRLKQSLEMVGFSVDKQKRLLAVLSAVLHLGNVEFSKKSTYHNDEAVIVKNADMVTIISNLLMVKEEALLTALTCKRTKAAKGEMIIINYKMGDAVATRDAMAKCLYGALFDWIVMQVNQALLSKQDVREHKGNYIGVLDIFGFEDFGDQNYFEQFCINFANEHLHFYFNQHVFKYEQEEYKREGINWKNIDFHDNVGCLNLIEGRPHGLLCLLDDQCNFPGASNETVLQKFVNHHNNVPLFEVPPCRQSAFVIKHYAGKVKYQIKDFREKNLDLMRPDVVCLLKGSSSAFVRELVGSDPLAIFRWQILKAFFKAYLVFTQLREQSKKRRAEMNGAVALKTNLVTTRKGGIDKGKKSFDNGKESFSSVTVRKQSSLSPIKPNDNRNIVITNQNCNSSPQCIHGSLLRAASSPCPLHGINTVLCSNEAKVLQRANKILQKHKVNKSSSLKGRGIEKSIKNLQTLKVIVGKTNSIQHLGRTGRKQTQTVTAQFQWSLNQLMETLSHANPFFVRCIKSNADKIPNHFDDMLVLVQLRYTGMLETVRIRQSGYSVRLSFEEFIQHYRVLLARGLLSSQHDIKDFLLRMNLNRDNYQMGKSKIFMRESEKLALDDMLHTEILQRIITLQRWVRTWITRRAFIRMKAAVVLIQTHTRRWLAQQRLTQLKWMANYEGWAATTIQKTWKSFQTRSQFLRLKRATLAFQAHSRGFLCRKQMQRKWLSKQKAAASAAPLSLISNVDSQSSHSDEAFLSKGSSQEELEVERSSCQSQKPMVRLRQQSKDSEDSSGVHEDSESESNPLETVPTHTLQAVDPPPPLPPRRQPQLIVVPCHQSNPHEILEPVATEPLPNEMDLDDKPRLDRRRNRPMRKLSLKRSKSSNKAVGVQSESSAEKSCLNPEPTGKAKQPVREIVSEPMPVSPVKVNPEDPFPQQKGAFQKAKRSLRTFIIGGSSRSDRKVKDQFPPPVKRDSDENVSEDGNSLYFSSQQLKSEAPLPSPPIEFPTTETSSSNFTLTHHNVKSSPSINKNDVCALCGHLMAQRNSPSTAFKCCECNGLFHSKCLPKANNVPCAINGSAAAADPQHGLASAMITTVGSSSGNNPARPPRIKSRNKGGKNSSSNFKNQRHNSKVANANQNSSQLNPTGGSSWSVTRTAEFIDPRDILITDVQELHNMETFIGKKIRQMEESKRNSSKESMVDVVFKLALKEFKANLISTYSVASLEGVLHITYKSLIDHFEQVMLNVCQKENTWKSFPVIMGVNAFRGFLDEFRNMSPKVNLEEKPAKKPAYKRKRSKKKENREETIDSYGHTFKSVVANIPTTCEVCSSLMWLMEKVWVCRGCKLTCHKKCTVKVTVTCRDNCLLQMGKKVFGSPLQRMVSEEMQVPAILEQLMSVIEVQGLYTEGVYRKSGTTSKIAELKNKIDEEQDIDLQPYSVHVLTAVLKSFFREMPEPLMTYDLYDEFLWATAISDPQERVQAIYSHISKLPRANYDVLERLTFHLARIAQVENANRMNANSLAIVFAPCILRTNKPMQMQDKLSDISKQTICIQCIINQRLTQLCDTLADIDILDSACHTASSRLSSLRLSKLHLNRESTSQLTGRANQEQDPDEEEEVILKQQIEHLRYEKAHLTTMLPSFRLGSAGSDEDLLMSGTDLESTLCGSLEDTSILHSPKREKPVAFKASNSRLELPSNARSQKLRHLTKHRASLPKRRLPSRFHGGGGETRTNNENKGPKQSSKKKRDNNKKEERRDVVSLFHPDDKPVVV